MSEEDTAKESAPELVSVAAEGEDPAATKESPSAAESEAPPAAEGEAPPAAEGEAPPAAVEEAPPAAEGEAPPAVEDESPPVVDGEGTHAAEGEAPAAAGAEGEPAAAEGAPPAECAEGAAPAEAAEGAAPADGAEGGDGAAPAEVAEGAEGDTPAEGGEGGEGGEEGAAAPAEEAEPVDLGPPPPPPYVPPEVGDDYVFVKDLPPIPLPYGLNDEGKKVPLDGVESIFLTGTTAELVEIGHLGSDKDPPVMSASVAKDKILSDIQFRGAISDFHPIKQKIVDSECEIFIVRVNEDDIYGDGNNFEVALTKEVGDLWEFIITETARREHLLKDEVLREAIEKMKPRSQKKRKVKPWISGGSEVEVQETMLLPGREPIKMILSKVRREFNQGLALSDKDAHELWNSSQMECRPFKDPNFDLRKSEQDVAVQAVPATTEMAVQASGNRPRPNSTQYEPLDTVPEEKEAILYSDTMRRTLERAARECEYALIQNEVTNIYQDDFSLLSEEDGVSGNRKESIVTEYQSFTHLTYSKNKVVSAIQWLPNRKGVVAVACTEALTHSERVVRAGRPSNAYILVWNFKDPVHPEYVLQAPFEIFAFQFNPTNPDIVVAGCYNGQVVIWDISAEQERIAALKQSSSLKEDANEDAAIPVVKSKYTSIIESSHHSLVTDLHWLPGVEISSRGRVSKSADQNDCSFFATISGDGKVNFWDIRMEKLMKKGRKNEDPLDLAWKPTHSVHLISLLGMDLSSTRLCFNFKELEQGQFFVGSFDGELVYADFVRPEGEDNPDYAKSCNQIHVGPIVALQRSPFFDDIILSVGDWSFQIWKEGGHPTTPLFQSAYAAEYYTAGCWSPTRPAVIYLTDTAGNLEIWDLLDRSHEPSIRVTLASTPFMSISFMNGGASTGAQGAAAGGAAGGGGGGGGGGGHGQQFLALGDSEGSLRIVELPRNLRRPVPNERKLMGVYLEREAARIEDVMARIPARGAASKAAEERKKAKEEAEAAARDKEKELKEALASGQPIPREPKAKVADFDEKAEAEYYKLEQKFKVQLGLVEEEVRS